MANNLLPAVPGGIKTNYENFLRNSTTLPYMDYNIDEEGNVVPIEGSQRALSQTKDQRDFIRSQSAEMAQRRRDEYAVEEEMALKLNERIKAKGEVDNYNVQWEYSPEQEKQMMALDDAYNKSLQQVADGTLTVEQQKMIAEKIAIQKNHILPAARRGKPTPQEQVNSNIITLPNGQKAFWDGKKLDKLSTGVDIDPKDWNQMLADSKDRLTKYEGDREITPSTEEVFNDAMQSVKLYQQMMGIVRGQGGESQQGGGQPPQAGQRPYDIPKRDPASDPRIQQRMAIDKIMAIGLKEGKTPEQVKADLAKITGNGQVEPTVTPPENNYKPYSELTPANQAKIKAQYEKEEAVRQSPVSTTPGMGIIGGVPLLKKSGYKKMSFADFIKKYDSDEAFRAKYTVERKAGVYPKDLKEATQGEKNAMYAAHVDSIPPGSKPLDRGNFEIYLERNPDKIKEYLNMAKKKSKNDGLKDKGIIFDPEGIGYDYESAIAAGMGPDETGHWPSRNPKTGQILKGRGHETYYKTIKSEEEAGYEIYKGKDGKYYSKKKIKK